MTALDQFASAAPKEVFALLPKIRDTANCGSVITRDHAVGILTKLGALPEYADVCLPMLVEMLRSCPNKQLPRYAEMSQAVAKETSKPILSTLISERLAGLAKDLQKKRVLRFLKRLA